MLTSHARRTLPLVILGTVAVLLSPGAANANHQYSRPCGCPCPGYGMTHHMMHDDESAMWDHMEQGMMNPDMLEERRPGMMQRGAMSRGQSGGRMMHRFAAVDADQDGAVSAEEAAAQSESVFAQMDTDGDDSVTEDEFMALHMGPTAGRSGDHVDRRRQNKQARFQAIDLDDDGNVTKEEFLTAAENRFQASDRDQNGLVTPWEFRMARRL